MTRCILYDTQALLLLWVFFCLVGYASKVLLVASWTTEAASAGLRGASAYRSDGRVDPRGTAFEGHEQEEAKQKEKEGAKDRKSYSSYTMVRWMNVIDVVYRLLNKLNLMSLYHFGVGSIKNSTIVFLTIWVLSHIRIVQLPFCNVFLMHINILSNIVGPLIIRIR
jgi:hypothetical protein